jgi:hypothetical protein
MGLMKAHLLEEMERENWAQFVGDQVELKGAYGRCSQCDSTEYEIEALEEMEGHYRYRLRSDCGHRVRLTPEASARLQGQLEEDSWDDD